jgi:hypothetical protein
MAAKPSRSAETRRDGCGHDDRLPQAPTSLGRAARSAWDAHSRARRGANSIAFQVFPFATIGDTLEDQSEPERHFFGTGIDVVANVAWARSARIIR